MRPRKHDPTLLRELKRAYEYYINGDVTLFDETLGRVILTFGSNARKIVERVDDELSGRREEEQR